MKTKTVLRFIAAGLLAAGLVAAKKDRAWKDGKIMAARTVDTGVTPTQRSIADALRFPGAAKTITAAELEIFADDYAYTVRDLGSGLLKRPCRYIVGDGVKYFQEKSILFLVDTDGAECRAQIMTQERLPADLKTLPPARAALKQ
jgi:hypothetical protein